MKHTQFYFSVIHFAYIISAILVATSMFFLSFFFKIAIRQVDETASLGNVTFKVTMCQLSTK